VTVVTAVVVTIVVAVKGMVTVVVNVLGGCFPPGASGSLGNFFWEPMNKPMKIELRRRKSRRRMSNILLRAVNGC
jgi:hypothetical protein